MHYDPNLDRSEEFGWKKWAEEPRPSEEEQKKWSTLSILAAIKLSFIALLLEV